MAAKSKAWFWSEAATSAFRPETESGPMKASGRMTIFTFPVRTYLGTMLGKTSVSNWSQKGHWRSMYSTRTTGAAGEPSVRPFCGIPLRSWLVWVAPWAQSARGKALVGHAPVEAFGPLPPLSVTARTTPTTEAAIASTRGEARRGRKPDLPAPLERTGGGVAACLCCLALLPLGIGRKGSRLFPCPGTCEDQESDEKEKPRERERRDREVAERRVEAGGGDPVEGAAGPRRRRDHARGRLRDRVVLDEHVVDRRAGAEDGERKQIARDAVLPAPGEEEEQERQGVHADPLEPAEVARLEARDLGVEEAAARGECRHDEAGPELVAPDPAAHRVERPADTEQGQHREQEQERNEHLSRDTEPRERVDHVALHSCVPYPPPGWRNWSDAPDSVGRSPASLVQARFARVPCAVLSARGCGPSARVRGRSAACRARAGRSRRLAVA